MLHLELTQLLGGLTLSVHGSCLRFLLSSLPLKTRSPELKRQLPAASHRLPLPLPWGRGPALPPPTSAYLQSQALWCWGSSGSTQAVSAAGELQAWGALPMLRVLGMAPEVSLWNPFCSCLAHSFRRHHRRKAVKGEDRERVEERIQARRTRDTWDTQLCGLRPFGRWLLSSGLQFPRE